MFCLYLIWWQYRSKVLLSRTPAHTQILKVKVTDKTFEFIVVCYSFNSSCFLNKRMNLVYPVYGLVLFSNTHNLWHDKFTDWELTFCAFVRSYKSPFPQKPVRKFSEVFNIFGHGNHLGDEYQRSRSLCPTVGCCKGHLMFWLSICAHMPICAYPSVPV